MVWESGVGGVPPFLPFTFLPILLFRSYAAQRYEVVSLAEVAAAAPMQRMPSGGYGRNL